MLVHPTTRRPLPPRLPQGSTIVRGGNDVLVVIDGVAVLVHDAVAYCARHRDAIIAAVVRADGDAHDAAALVDACAQSLPSAEPATPFVSDYTDAEAEDEPPPALVDDALAALLDDGSTPLSWLIARAPAADVVVELGPGAGALSSLLAPRARRRFIVVDLALPAVLIARAKARAALAASAQRRVVGIVADAADLPLADGAADVVVASNVVDAVDDPRGAIAEAARALRPGGRLLLTTPRPHLHERGADGADAPLREALADSGLEVVEWHDGLRWPRVHSDRHVELWTCVGVVALKRAASARRGAKAGGTRPRAGAARSR